MSGVRVGARRARLGVLGVRVGRAGFKLSPRQNSAACGAGPVSAGAGESQPTRSQRQSRCQAASYRSTTESMSVRSAGSSGTPHNRAQWGPWAVSGPTRTDSEGVVLSRSGHTAVNAAGDVPLSSPSQVKVDPQPSVGSSSSRYRNFDDEDFDSSLSSL
jgi:hypothetical protein